MHALRGFAAFLALVLLASSPAVSDTFNSFPVGLAAGWTAQPLSYTVQGPYDQQPGDRYTYDSRTQIHHFWLFDHDRAPAQSYNTRPRTEMRIHNDYTWGRHQFEADVMVPRGTTGVSIMQIFGGAGGHATSLQLRVTNGTLRRYRSEVLMTDIYDRWFRLNVMHDAGTGSILIYINNVLVLATADRGGSSWYFKCGVYGNNEMSHKMESYFKNIRIYS